MPNSGGRWQHRPPTLRGDIAAQTAVLFVQIAIAISQWGKAQTLAAKVILCTFPLYLLCLMAFMVRHPTAYWRCRGWLLPLLPVVALPWTRRLDVGLGLQLQRCARPGTVGTALDVLRFTLASRALGLMLWSSTVLFPPLTAVLLHGITTATSMNPGSFCSGPLLTGAIAAEHQRALASLLDWAVIPLVVVQPIAEPLAPLFTGAAAGEAATSSGVRQRLGRTIAACNRSLYQLLGGTADSTIGRVGIAYFIFGTAWLLSKDLASKEWV